MKKMKLLMILGLTISLFVLQSCDGNENSCENIICNYGGTCDNGTCDCLPGYEGDACEIFSGSKMLGNFDITTSCDSTTTSLGVSFSGDSYATLFINNLHKTAANVKADMTSSTTFSIIEQPLSNSAFDISGTGTILSDGHFTIDYSVLNQVTNDTINCMIDAIRQ